MAMKSILLAGAGWLGLAGIALAAKENLDPHWLSPQEVNAIVESIPRPPAAGSDAEKADLQEEIAAQKNRTPERIAEAKRDANYSVVLFTNLIGPKIAPQADPVTFHFFNELNGQIGEVVGASKDRFKRPRPYLTHPDVIHPLYTANGWSYPSGHAIAQSRVDAGVHYTSDIHEGEIVGREVAKELLAKPAVQTEMKAAEAEV